MKALIAITITVILLGTPFYCYAGSENYTETSYQADQPKKNCENAQIKKRSFFETILDIFMVVTLPFSLLSPQPALEFPSIRQSFQSLNSLIGGECSETVGSPESFNTDTTASHQVTSD